MQIDILQIMTEFIRFNLSKEPYNETIIGFNRLYLFGTISRMIIYGTGIFQLIYCNNLVLSFLHFIE